MNAMKTMTSKLLRTSSAFALLLASAASTFANTRDVIHKTFDLNGPGQLVVGAEASNITVTTWDKPQVDVTITRAVTASSEAREKELLDKDKIGTSLDGNKVTVTIDIPGNWRTFRTRRDYRVDIKAPAACSAGLKTSGGDINADGLQGNVEAGTSGGDLTLKHIGGDVKARTSGGDVKLDAIKGTVEASTSGGDMTVGNGNGKLSAHTSGGDVRVENQTGDINAGTSGGDVSLSGITGAAEASTSGGDVSASFAASPTGNVQLKSTGGDVNITLPASATVHINAHTTGGEVRTDFPLTSPDRGSESHKQGDINGGGTSVELHTTGGDIHIVKAK
jgi:DUF4097 and DUF4098 domain-containing protein YvlB